MTDEKSKIVENVEQETQETKTEETKTEKVAESSDTKNILDEFNPLAFADVTSTGKDKYNDKKEENETEDKKDSENSEESDSETDDDSWKWDEIKTESKEESELKEEDNWDEDNNKTGVSKDEEKTSGQDEQLDWSKFAQELGISGATKEDIVSAINTVTAQGNPETISKFNQFLSMGDRELLAEEMKVDGMEEHDIEEALDKMEDSGVMKREAFRIRRQINNAVELENKSSAQKNEQQTIQSKKEISENKKLLQTELKSMERFMGGKVSKDQAKKAYNYIVSGDMVQDIWQSHGNAAEVALFMLFKDKFAKILVNQGKEDGKASILNKITSPSLTRSSNPSSKVKKGGFDPAEFMKE